MIYHCVFICIFLMNSDIEKSFMCLSAFVYLQYSKKSIRDSCNYLLKCVYPMHAFEFASVVFKTL